mgnify:CR=1 FL=1
MTSYIAFSRRRTDSTSIESWKAAFIFISMMSKEVEPIDEYVVVTKSEINESDMNEAIDVSIDQDGGVLKQILRAAPEDARGPPPDGYVVTVHYVVGIHTIYLATRLTFS